MATSDDTIDDRAEEIVNEFMFFDDWMGRYQHLIELGDSIPLIEEEHKNDDTRIHGCQSEVWVHTDFENGHVRYTGDSNAKITKGLAALLIRLMDEQPPEAVAEADLEFLEDIGMDEHLSPTRQNGLHAMFKQMKARALYGASSDSE